MHELSRGLRLLQPEDYCRMPWKNGLGMTTEIVVFPADAGLDGKPFEWRVSLAEIETDCEFSLFPGYERTILLAAGSGMELSFDSAPPRRMERRFQPFVFKGDWQTCCRLLDGPVRDFNIMTARAACSHDCTMVTNWPHALRYPQRDVTVLVYCFSGSLQLECQEIGKLELIAQHTLMLSGSADKGNLSSLVISAMTAEAIAAIIHVRPANIGCT